MEPPSGIPGIDPPSGIPGGIGGICGANPLNIEVILGAASLNVFDLKKNNSKFVWEF